MKRVLLLVAVVLSFSAAPALAAPSPGSSGLGDRLFPQLGNGGYDVQHYDLDLRYATSAPTQAIDGTVTILAKATQDLSRFDLDFAGQSVGGDHRQRAAGRVHPHADDLVITPKRAAAQRAAVRRPRSRTSSPRRPRRTPTTSRRRRSSSTRRARRPRRSRTSRTCSCRPTTTRATRRASTSASTCPAGQTAVANGVKLAQWTDRGRSHFVYLQRQPMATELLQLAVGQYDVTNVGVHSGVFLRDVTSQADHGRDPAAARRHAVADRLHAGGVGKYPFDLYGSLVVEADLGFALETQTLELMDTSLVPRLHAGHVGPDAAARAVAHVVRRQRVPVLVERPVAQRGPRELVRVPLRREQGLPRGRHRELPRRHRLRRLRRPDEGRLRPRRRVARRVGPGRAADQRGHAVRPPALPRRRARALRAAPEDRRRGVPAHRARLRATASATARSRTDDYIALAAQVSAATDVVPFLRDWVYGTKTPAMPGHPDWTVNPVDAAKAPASLSAAAARASASAADSAAARCRRTSCTTKP